MVKLEARALFLILFAAATLPFTSGSSHAMNLGLPIIYMHCTVDYGFIQNNIDSFEHTGSGKNVSIYFENFTLQDGNIKFLYAKEPSGLSPDEMDLLNTLCIEDTTPLIDAEFTSKPNSVRLYYIWPYSAEKEAEFDAINRDPFSCSSYSYERVGGWLVSLSGGKMCPYFAVLYVLSPLISIPQYLAAFIYNSFLYFLPATASCFSLLLLEMIFCAVECYIVAFVLMSIWAKIRRKETMSSFLFYKDGKRAVLMFCLLAICFAYFVSTINFASCF